MIADADATIQIFLFAGALYPATMTFIKLSILALYWGLSRATPRFRQLVVVLAVLITAMGIALTLAMLLHCIPIHRAWSIDPTIEWGPDSKCVNYQALLYAQAILNLVTDLVVYVLPMKLLWSLKLPVMRRIGLCMLFGLGAM